LKFISVSPPKNVKFTVGESPASVNKKSTDCFAVASFMKRGFVFASTILSSPYS
jgi:hypothetical protein